MATGERDDGKSSNPEGHDETKDERLPKMAGQVAASHATADGYTLNAGSSANPGSAFSSTDEEPKEAGGRGSPNAMTPSDNARRDSCPPSKTSVDEPKGPTSKTNRAKSRPSVGSARKQNTPPDHRNSKVSISSKVSNLMSSTSLHKSASISSARTVVSASTSPIGNVTPECPPRRFNAATQNQLTPELYPASPVPDAGAAVTSDAAGTQRRHLKNQLCGRSIPGSELLLRGDSKEDLEKGEGKEKAHAEVAKNVAETPEEKGKPEKFAEAKKQRKKAPRGLKMPDGTYVGLNEKNPYLRAMYKEHLKCDYVPFCILGVLMVVVVALVYLYAFRPVRNLLGVNTKDEEQDDPASIHNVPSNSRLQPWPRLFAYVELQLTDHWGRTSPAINRTFEQFGNSCLLLQGAPMTERSDSSPRRLSLVNPFSGPAAARAPTPTPPYSRNVTPPAYGVFAPHTMAAPYTCAVPQPWLSTSYHYVPVPCAGVWPQPQHPTGAPLAAAVELAGLYRPSSPLAAQPLPPSAFLRNETLASVARCSNSSPRRRSTGRSDKPYMLQKCGPFFTWQLLIMWMAVLGTVVFVCSYGAFRHYLGERAVEAVYLNASCSFRNPCRGVGFFCVGGRCVCGPDYEVQGELCGLKRNAVTDDPVVTVTDVTVPLTSTRGARSASNSGRPDPRKGIHERHSLDKESLHAQTTSFEDDDFTFVIATFQYEDRVNKHVAPIRSTAVAPDGAVRHPLRNHPTKMRTRKKFKMN